MKHTKRTKVRTLWLLAAVITIGIAFIGCKDGDGNDITHNHTWGEWEIITPATCREEGEETRTCIINATHTETRAIPVDQYGHDMRPTGKVSINPTCENDGVGETLCAHGCGHTEAEGVIDALGHDLERRDGGVSTEPTCAEEGVGVMECIRDECEHTEAGGVIDMLEHEWGGYVQITAPTCYAKGVNQRNCEDCNHADPVTVEGADMIAHTLSDEDWYPTTPATCLATGLQERECRVAACDYIEDDTDATILPIDKLSGHYWVYAQDATIATCVSPGSGERECQRDGCDDKSTSGATYPIDPNNHAALGKVHQVRVAPTCMNNGREYLYCDLGPMGCGQYDPSTYQTVNALDHDWIDNWVTTKAATCIANGDRERECNRSGCIVKQPEIDSAAVPALGHEWVNNWVTTQLAVCTVNGNRKRECNRLDCTVEQTEIGSAALPSFGGHQYPATTPATCTAASVKYSCNRLLSGVTCDHSNPETVVNALGHDWRYESQAVPPTCTAAGNGHRYCERTGCVADEVHNTYPALDHDWNYWTLNNADITALTGIGVTRTCRRNLSGAACTENASVTLEQYIKDYAPYAGTAAAPVPLKVSIDLDAMGTAANGWTQLLTALDAGSKLVALDLSGSTRSSNGDFTTGSTSSTAAPGLAGLNRIVSLVMPNTTVTSIASDAFRNCTNLRSVTIGNSVTSIGFNAFSRCTGLTSVTIPNSVTSIGSNAFDSNTGLTSVHIGSGVTSIGGGAFQNCTNLASITVDPANANFSANNNVLFSATAILFVPSAANFTEPRSVTIPNGVTSIGSSAFFGRTGLTSVTIPNSVTSIGSSAFSGCTGLTSVHIGSGVTTIGGAVFQNCTNLANITVDPANANFSANNNVLFSATAIVFVPIGANLTGSVTIPDGITSIGTVAFQNRTGLTSITIPNSITSIDQSAFQGCTGLTSIGGTGSGASVEIPDSVTSIGVSAFNGCTGLTSITIPNGVTSINVSAFIGCTNLASITVDPANTNFSVNNNVLFSATDVVFVPSAANLTGSVTIPDGITSIGNQMFQNRTGLTSIVIPASATSIGGTNAFLGCTSLTLVTLERWMPELEGTARISTAGTTPFGTTAGTQFNTDLRIVVPAGSVAAYKAAANWNTTTGAALRNRIHAAGCSNTSVTDNCTQCD